MQAERRGRRPHAGRRQFGLQSTCMPRDAGRVARVRASHGLPRKGRASRLAQSLTLACVACTASRTAAARALNPQALIQWKRNLIQDLGGEEVATVQQRELVDLAARTKLYLDSVDAWLMEQWSLVNARGGSAGPNGPSLGRVAAWAAGDDPAGR